MKPRGHINYQILLRDASEGIHYSSFEDYYSRRLVNSALFFPKNPQGAVKAVVDRVREHVKECWESFAKDHPDLILPTASPPDCCGLPQAGGACQPLSESTP